MADRKTYGKVYLVGAGPGDPGLITVRGLECLRQADVVVYDALANEALLRHAPQAEHIFAGKKRGLHALPQEDITRILLEQATRVQRVVRLKGGDPFVFGRGGEEALELARLGVPFEVVPGVTAAIAAPAYAGIPVTHRGLATSFSLITGHADPQRPAALHLDRLALDGTLAFYMGVKNLPAIVEELLRLGRPADTPAAVIEWGTYMRQRTIVAPLDGIEAAVREADVQPPAMLLVGDVVSLREQIDWFEQRPLFGKRIVVTRAASARGNLAPRLREMGADAVEMPTVEFHTQAGAADLLSGRHDWIVLVSPNAVAAVGGALEQAGKDARALTGTKLLAIGSATVRALRDRCLIEDLVSEGHEPEKVIDALHGQFGDLAGQRVLLPCSDLAHGDLAPRLRGEGAEVDEAVAYTAAVPANATETAQRLLDPAPHLVCFTSSAAVRNFAAILGDAALEDFCAAVPAAVMGPVSAATARDAGFRIAVEPAAHTLDALAEAIAAWAMQGGARRADRPE